jgi:hypothetical protein
LKEKLITGLKKTEQNGEERQIEVGCLRKEADKEDPVRERAA